MTRDTVAKAFFTAAVGITLMGDIAHAAGGSIELRHRDWSFEGPFGTFDRASAQRGLQVYREVCASCHSMEYVTFRTLDQIGFSEPEIKAMAAEYIVEDGPDDSGDMFERPGKPFDVFPAPYANSKAAAAANGGKAPPDLSLMVEARVDGANYVYSLLMGYDDPPADFVVPEGAYYNAYYPGHAIAMSAPLIDDQVEYQDGTPATINQMSIDIVNFLAWTTEPNMEERKQTGVVVLLFLFVMTILCYMAYRNTKAQVVKY
jgi:ubiquinol-cytochrome c reductase cytochrome c1 subunit